MEKLFDVEPLETFKSACEDILTNLYNSTQLSNPVLEPFDTKTAKEDIKSLIANKFDLKTIHDHLKNKNFDNDKVNCLITLIESKKSELLYATLLNHISKYGDTVTDFDWVLKIVMGTNDLKTLSYPLLQLILHTVNTEGMQQQKVYDVNKEMLNKMISLLENIDDL